MLCGSWGGSGGNPQPKIKKKMNLRIKMKIITEVETKIGWELELVWELVLCRCVCNVGVRRVLCGFGCFGGVPRKPVQQLEV